MVSHPLVAFIAAAGVLTITPGADTALVLRTALSCGPRSAIFAAVGIGLGCLVWGASVALGFGVLVAQSALAFTIVKVAGAAYLVSLGARLLWKPRTDPSIAAAIDEASPAQSGATALRRGFLTNVLNPKVGVFYITFLPQFVPTGANIGAYSFVLASVHVLLGAVWFAVLIAATVPLASILGRPRVVRAMDRLTGCVFVALGVKLALAS